MSRPDQTLRALAVLAQNLADRWVDYETVEANLAAPSMAAGGQGDGRGSSVPDPTHGIAASHLAYWGTVDDLETALQYLRAAQRRVDAVQRHHAPLARHLEAEARAARCDGSWDPACVNNAVRDGKCWRCIKAQQRARSKAG